MNNGLIIAGSGLLALAVFGILWAYKASGSDKFAIFFVTLSIVFLCVVGIAMIMVGKEA